MSRRFLSLVRDFIVFEDSGSGAPVKKMAGYHQFHAVHVAVAETLRAAELREGASDEEGGRYESGRKPGGELGDRRIGVVWHTQGSGKSLTMAFYAGRIIREPAMENPTVVVLTDRNDLDDQLFSTFSRCSDLLRQPPVQAESRADLRARLSVESGGVVFTTIQKFMPPAGAPSPQPSPSGGRGSNASGDMPALSGRRNIVVVADEAHRSQYDFIDGFARHMRDALPHASFVGFTGTPIELQDANTRAVFGDYISIYDIQRAVDDKATVPIYYESRLAKLTLDEDERPKIDPGFEEATEGEEVERKEKLKTKWAQLEAVVGSENRLRLVAQDIVDHFEQRLEALEGKAMVVCMSRRICIDLYRELVRLRPDWHHDDDDKGSLKVVMTGAASDPPEWQPHIRNKPKREALAKRFRDPGNPLRMVLVRDMWLTGFDAPSLHTMYVDKPMRGHGLMQAIARVNRVFQDKPGGLVVDYLGLAHELKRALATYTESGGKGQTSLDQAEAVAVMLEKYEICRGLFHGFNWSGWFTGTAAERLSLLPAAQEHVLAQENGKDRCMQSVLELSQAFALAVPHEEALRIRDDVAFFQAVRSVLAKRAPADARPEEELDHAVRQIISRAVSSEGVIDIFAAAGLEKPDLSILSDEFLSEVRGMPQRNLAVELLQKLLKGELVTRRRKNVVQARSFAEMLEQTLRRYQNRAIEAAQVIEELIQLARDLREASARGEALGLSEDELAFYDALETNDSAVRCSATRPFGTSRANWSRPCAATSRSTGPCARTCAPNSGCWSSASCASTAIRPTSRKRRRGPCWNKRRCCPSAGPPESVSEDHCRKGKDPLTPALSLGGERELGRIPAAPLILSTHRKQREASSDGVVLESVEVFAEHFRDLVQIEGPGVGQGHIGIFLTKFGHFLGNFIFRVRAARGEHGGDHGHVVGAVGDLLFNGFAERGRAKLVIRRGKPCAVQERLEAGGQ